MAYDKAAEIKKQLNTLSCYLFVVKALRFVFFGYSILCFLFWFLNCFEFEWLYIFTWLFIIPYKIVNVFYKPPELGVDFTLAVIGAVMLTAGLAFEYLLNDLYLKISELQELYEKYTEQKKAKKNRRKSAKPVPGGSREFPNMRGFNPELITEDDNIMLLFIIQFHIHKLQLGPDDAELAFPDAEQWRKRANKHILESLKQQNNQPMQKGYYKKNLFLAYRDFGCTDSFIDYIRSEINFIAADFAAQNIDVQYGCVFSAVTQLSALEKELDLMDTILSLHFTNKFILTSSFNKAYDLKSERKHAQILKGMYNLSKNLSVSNVQQLYEFKDFQTNEAAIR